MKRNVFFFAALTCAANLYAVEPVDTAKAVMLQDVQGSPDKPRGLSI